MSQNHRERLRRAQIASAKQKRLNRILGVAAAILAVGLIAVFAVVLFQDGSNRAQQAASVVTPPDATADGKAIVVSPGKAADGAPVVEIFFDYQCPVCKQFEQFFGDTLEALAESGQIELRYRTMTFLDAQLGNDSSVQAGIGAACADTVGRYSDYHDAVFAAQPATEGDGYSAVLLRDTIPETISLTGRDLETFQSCFDNASTKPFVDKAAELGMQDEQAVNKRVATPIIHVNGHDLPMSEVARATPDTLLQLIQSKA